MNRQHFREQCRQYVIVRAGENADYEPFDDLQSAIESLQELGIKGPLQWFNSPFGQLTFAPWPWNAVDSIVSIFHGTADCERLRALSPSERAQVAKGLARTHDWPTNADIEAAGLDRLADDLQQLRRTTGRIIQRLCTINGQDCLGEVLSPSTWRIYWHGKALGLIHFDGLYHTLPADCRGDWKAQYPPQESLQKACESLIGGGTVQRYENARNNK